MITKSNQAGFLFFVILSFISKFSFSQGDTMYVDGRHIYSAAGEKVILRGVNEMFVWSSDNAGSWTHPEIAKTGANCVRIMWMINGDASRLAKNIDNCVANKMIAMPECHDATGEWGKLDDCIMFWKNPIIFNAIQKNKKWTLLNVGNEVGNGSVTSAMFLTGYKKAIDSLRGWGYTVPIVIDAPTWGQNVDVLFDTWEELLEYDPLKNVIFSAHSYWSSPANYQRIANESVNNNMPIIIGEGPSPTAYPQCRILDYKTGLKVSGENEIGWLIWSWGMMSNGHCKPNLDVTTDGKFGNWETVHSEILAFDHPYSLMRSSERPASFYTDSIVPVTGLELVTNTTNLSIGDSATIEVIMAPVNAADKSYSMLLLQSKEILKFNSDSTAVIGLAEGSSVVRVMHPGSGIRRTITFNVSQPVYAPKIENSKHEIEVFPNPASNILFVKFTVQADVDARIYNSTGKLIEEVSAHGNFNVELEDYNSGIYFIQIDCLDETKTVKFIKE